MRLPLAVTALVASVLTAGAAFAQDPATDGQYRADLMTLITSVSGGTCPATLMGDEVLAKCEESIDQIGAALGGLGPVDMVTLSEATGEGADRVESYEVTFQSGDTLVWSLGKRGEDGRYAAVSVHG